MILNTKHRTDAPEIMDDFAMEGDILRDALDKIAKINRLLGGNAITLKGIKKLIAATSKSQKISIIDIGCGNGDMLRSLGDYANAEGFSFELIGIDANQFTIQHARNLSDKYPNIQYFCEDICDTDFQRLKYDIAICTLTLHHFKDNAILDLMTIFKNNCNIGIVINDLHRSAISYRMFQLLCIVFGLNYMSRQDGLTSILRGFKKEELVSFSQKLNFKKYTVNWKWAFRYEWLIWK
jgi:2-polyprenyl-3-methyl-5-hydroxy-6-metoxy-1,4-benzoquinol methylase